MKVLEVKVLRGPNVWSTYRKKLIAMKLDLGELEQFPTNKIEGFLPRLKAAMPSLHEHGCSEKKPGGFFERVHEGTWLGHVVEHIALEMQSLAGMECGYGRTRSTRTPGVYHVVFSYLVENAGKYAALAAVQFVAALVKNEQYDLAADINELARINRREGLGPTSLAILSEAKKRNIPFKRLDDNSLIMLGQGVNQKLICASTAGTTSSIAVDIAGNKNDTKKILDRNYIPCAKGMVVTSAEELLKAISSIGYPVVTKPLNGNHGRAVKVNINNETDAINGFIAAQQISYQVIVEKYVNGSDYRFLVINYKLQAVARRTPALVVGDGTSTIAELIEKTNADPRRGEGHEKTLTTIKIDDATISILNDIGLTLQSVISAGEIIFLKDAANLSSGGTASDVTDMVHPDNVFMAERIARLVNLDICGIDIVAEDITNPINANNGAVIEVNAAPGLRMHLAPAKGIARNVAEPIIDMLYPEGNPSRIPVVAVTGTNGKTTTTRLIAHLAKRAGQRVGYTTTEGIYIQDRVIHYGDCTGPASAEVVLRDPIVDFAVLECARGGLLRSGLGFDKCNISIITNITEDHLGLNDIHSLRDLAKVKAVVARSTFDDGHAILNADDDRVYKIKKELDCNIALFSIKEDNERISSHCVNGGWAAIVEKGNFTLLKGEWKIRVAKVKEVPLTMNGQATCMIKNVLPAILAAAISGFDIQTIRKALQEFVPGPENTPGRMNVFNFDHCNVMIDYAHNADGLKQLKEYMENVDAPVKIGIIGAPGDRRDEDIINFGECSAQMFDQIIIRHDDDGRGRTKEQITELLLRGIHKIRPFAMPLQISDEIEAIDHAVNNCENGSYITVCSDKFYKSIEFLNNKQKEQKIFNP